MTRRSKGFVELEWTCPNCDSRNRGSRKTCENCGAPQPENVQFQRAADEKVITDEKAAQSAKAGADIHCGFCGARNPATAKTCSQCGGDLAEGRKRQAGAALQAAPALPKVVTCKNCGMENSASERICSKCGSPLPRVEAPKPMPVQAVKSPATQKKPNWWLIGGIGAFLVLCCLAIAGIFFLPTKSLQGTVTDVAWQTSVPVQEVRAVDYNNEPGSAPSDAYNVSCHTESEEVCSERTVDQGNGYAEVVEECHTESQQYCSYTVDEWTTIQTYTLDGNDLYPVYESPSVSFDQRLGDASERLTVYFSTSEGQETYTPNTISEFQQFQIGTTWTLKMNLAGAVISVE